MLKKILDLPRLAGVAEAILIGTAILTVPAHDARATALLPLAGQPTMTGDWGGVRTSLVNTGIDFHLAYLGQIGSNVAGGKARGTDYTGQVTLGADWDLQKLFGGPAGGIVHSYVEDRAGRSVSADYTGSTFEEDGFYGSGENFRLMELAYEQNLFNKRLNVLVGYSVLGFEFGFSPVLCNANFLANGLCGHPQFLATDTGFQIGPQADWGGRVRFYPIPSLYIATGAYEVNPEYSNNNKGFDLNFDGATGAMIPVEIGYTSSFGPDKLIGHYKIGGIYDTSEVKDVEYDEERYGRYAGYLMVDQQVWKAADSDRKLTLFGEAGIADKRTSLESTWLSAGFIDQGIMPSRPEDALNAGYMYAETNPRKLKGEDVILAREGMSSFYLEPAQMLMEIDYNISVIRGVSFTPDFQYIWNPGSVSYKHYDNAVVVGAQGKVVF